LNTNRKDHTMEPRKLMSVLLPAGLALCLAVTPAWADRWRGRGHFVPAPRHHHHHHHHHDAWKWGALGVGAAIVGGALLAPHIIAAAPPPPPCAGRWETRRTWVPPSYERTWNPAHYDRWGNWVPGRWIEIERSPGYYRDERVWVDCR
jgi:hypothetical protein